MPSPRRAAAAATAVLLMGATLALPVSASTASRNDGNDSPGLLDVKRVVHRHGGGGILVHRIRTFDQWDTSIFSEGSYVYLTFSVNGGPAVDRILTVSASADGTPYAEMRNRGNDIVGYAKVWKRTARSLQLEFPKKLLGKKVSQYRWRARTMFHQDDHPDCGTSGGAIFLCEDLAPNKNKGKIRHRLR